MRYRRPDLDRMPGLRRITICKNPLISDPGVELIAEALKDDLWVKGYFIYVLLIELTTHKPTQSPSKHSYFFLRTLNSGASWKIVA